MADYAGTIANLVQGVSQQPKINRLEGQGSEQINFDSNIIYGLTQRTGSYMKSVLNFSTKKFATYTYKRSTTVSGAKDDIYSILIDEDGEGLIIKDFTTVMTLDTIPTDVKTYLASADPEKDLAFHTIADRTFVANKTKEVSMKVTTSPATPISTRGLALIDDATWEVLIRGVAANFGVQYDLEKDGSSIGTITTVIGTSADKITFIPVRTVLDGLSPAPSTLNTADINYEVLGDYLHIVGNGTRPNYEIVDGRGGKDFIVYTGSVIEAAKLPPHAPTGMVLKILGTDKNDYNDYYMKAVEQNTSSYTMWDTSELLWKETIGPSLKTILEEESMPISFQQASDDSFSAEFNIWKDRRVGDDTTAPLPSFIGNSIVAIGSFQERLFFLSDENIIFSQTKDRYDFFANTAREVLPDDTIDITANASDVTLLKKYIMFDKNLMLLSDKVQFVIKGNEPLKPSSMALATQYKIDLRSDPILLGTKLYVGIEHGEKYCGIREYAINNLSDNTESIILSENIDKYIEGSVTQISGNTNTNMLFVRSSTEANTIAVFQQFWQEDVRKQAAWSKWVFDIDQASEIKNIDVFDDNLVIWRKLSDESDVLQIETVNLRRYNTEDTDLTFNACLDIKQNFKLSDCVLGGNGIYTITISDLNIQDADNWTLIEHKNTDRIGHEVNIIDTTSGDSTETELEFSNELFDEDTEFIIGKHYACNYRMTLPHIRDKNGVAIDSGLMRLNFLEFLHKATGFYTTKVTYRHKPDEPYLDVFNTNNVGGWDSQLGIISIVECTHKVPIGELADYVEVDLYVEKSLLPTSFIAVNWEGSFRLHGRRF